MLLLDTGCRIGEAIGLPHNSAAVNIAIKRIVDAHNAQEEIKAKKQKRKPVILPRFSCLIFRHTFASRFEKRKIID